MDKNQFFKQYKPDQVDYKLPDGKTIKLNGLTLAQRSKLQPCMNEDTIKAQALIVALSCPLFDESDIDNIMGMPGELISDMANKVFDISGFNDSDEDIEKNSESGPN